MDMNNIFNKMADKIISDQERAIKSALPKDITNEQIHSRCWFFSNINTPNVRTLYLDDKPVVTIEDPVVSYRDEGDSVALVLTQRIGRYD